MVCTAYSYLLNSHEVVVLVIFVFKLIAVRPAICRIGIAVGSIMLRLSRRCQVLQNVHVVTITAIRCAITVVCISLSSRLHPCVVHALRNVN